MHVILKNTVNGPTQIKAVYFWDNNFWLPAAIQTINMLYKSMTYYEWNYSGTNLEYPE